MPSINYLFSSSEENLLNTVKHLNINLNEDDASIEELSRECSDAISRAFSDGNSDLNRNITDKLILIWFAFILAEKSDTTPALIIISKNLGKTIEPGNFGGYIAEDWYPRLIKLSAQDLPKELMDVVEWLNSEIKSYPYLNLSEKFLSKKNSYLYNFFKKIK